MSEMEAADGIPYIQRSHRWTGGSGLSKLYHSEVTLVDWGVWPIKVRGENICKNENITAIEKVCLQMILFIMNHEPLIFTTHQVQWYIIDDRLGSNT